MLGPSELEEALLKSSAVLEDVLRSDTVSEERTPSCSDWGNCSVVNSCVGFAEDFLAFCFCFLAFLAAALAEDLACMLSCNRSHTCVSMFQSVCSTSVCVQGTTHNSMYAQTSADDVPQVDDRSWESELHMNVSMDSIECVRHKQYYLHHGDFLRT